MTAWELFLWTRGPGQLSPAWTSLCGWMLNCISRSSLEIQGSSWYRKQINCNRLSTTITLEICTSEVLFYPGKSGLSCSFSIKLSFLLYLVKSSESSRASYTNKHSFNNLHVLDISESEACMPFNTTDKSLLRMATSSYQRGAILTETRVIIHWVSSAVLSMEQHMILEWSFTALHDFLDLKLLVVHT